MWRVKQEIRNGEPFYFIEKDGEKKGEFDSQRNAEEFAKAMNRREDAEKN